MTLQILTTGGTIDKIYFDSKSAYQVGDPQASGVLQRANVNLQFEVKSIMKKDSLDMTDADRDKIRSEVHGSSHDRILVTHGTDTMIKTAIAVGEMPDKTVVFTGSMYPAQFRDSDAVFNIGSAIAAVQALQAGTYIVMNGRIFDPSYAVKNIELNRFEDK